MLRIDREAHQQHVGTLQTRLEALHHRGDPRTGKLTPREDERDDADTVREVRFADLPTRAFDKLESSELFRLVAKVLRGSRGHGTRSRTGQHQPAAEASTVKTTIRIPRR